MTKVIFILVTLGAVALAAETGNVLLTVFFTLLMLLA